MDCQQIQLLHKLVWMGFVKLPTPLMMCLCVWSGCTDRWSHWYVDEPLFWAYEVWDNITDVLNRKPLLYYSQDKYSMASLNSHHLFSMLWNVYFVSDHHEKRESLLNAESSLSIFYLYSGVCNHRRWLLDRHCLESTIEARLCIIWMSFSWYLYLLHVRKSCELQCQTLHI